VIPEVRSQGTATDQIHDVKKVSALPQISENTTCLISFQVKETYCTKV
jgi:hypothetical protein